MSDLVASPNTVRVHLHRLKEKLSASGMLLITEAIFKGILVRPGVE